MIGRRCHGSCGHGTHLWGGGALQRDVPWRSRAERHDLSAGRTPLSRHGSNLPFFVGVTAGVC